MNAQIDQGRCPALRPNLQPGSGRGHHRRLAGRATLNGAMLLLPVLSGCSVFTPLPAWELTKGAAAAVNAAIGLGPGSAVNTIYHDHAPARQVCIEYNPDCQVPDMIPALLGEFRSRQISARIYESSANIQACPYWVRYSAYTAWDEKMFGKGYAAYVSSITLTMFDANGRVLSGGAYVSDRSVFGAGKWASVQTKLAPVVDALVAGQDKGAAEAVAAKEYRP
jgi:hypothetical protein